MNYYIKNYFFSGNTTKGVASMHYNEGFIKNTEFFTTAELAKKLKMNTQVITRKIQSGEIRAYKIGKDWRIPEQSVFDWLENNVNEKGKQSKKQTKKQIISEDKTGKLMLKTNKKKYLLEYILAQFEPNLKYSESDLNKIINRYHSDIKTIRNDFINEQMMELSEGYYCRCNDYKLIG
ncbi:MAG: hypothetical protein DRP35_08955 [Candidatus Zixiibacteriota bacterium]|nr:MAG: hypothetical protein DRP35_08955 [candidate division Zixibacteria bacterium]